VRMLRHDPHTVSRRKPRLNLPGIARHVQFLLDGGLGEEKAVILAGGAAGDFSTMTVAERLQVTVLNQSCYHYVGRRFGKLAPASKPVEVAPSTAPYRRSVGRRQPYRGINSVGDGDHITKSSGESAAARFA